MSRRKIKVTTCSNAVQTLFVFFVILAQTFKKGTLNLRISQELISFIFTLLETNILVRQQ